MDPEGLGREAETLAELGAGVPLSWAGTWCRWREAGVNGDQGGCGEVREALIVNVSATHSSILAWRISMDREAWLAVVHGVMNRRTRQGT